MKLRKGSKRSAAKKSLQFSKGNVPVKSAVLQPAWENRAEDAQ